MASQTPIPTQKYQEEASKRHRPEGTSQFEDLHSSTNPRLQNLATDPFADHATLDSLPEPLTSGSHIKFLITGTGLGGITTAIKLIQSGFTAHQIVLVEAAGGIGGTWYWNRFPGLHCDIESYVYLPFLEEMGYVPNKKYVSGVEIRGYLRDLMERFGLAERVMLRSEICGLRWDEEGKSWETDLLWMGGKENVQWKVHADFVILASGLFPYPHVPKIPGLADFEGEMLHTARWNYEVTGGSCETPFPVLEKLKGKRVGIVGTGATAIQVVPELAQYAGELYVFQRTPSQVNGSNQRNTDPTEWRERIATGPGWQKARMENFAEFLSGNDTPEMVNLIDDEWSKLKAYCAILGSRKFKGITAETVLQHVANLQGLDAEHSGKSRNRIKDIVKNPTTAEKLTPWYPTWCKRPTFSDTYLQTFNQEHVHLVDTDGKGIDSLAPHGVVVNGQEYPIDVLVWGTGYRTPAFGAADAAARIGIKILGRDGQDMTETVGKRGPCSLHSLLMSGFPNLFFMNASQSASTANVCHTMDVMTRQITYIIRRAHDHVQQKEDEKVIIESTEAAEEEWAMRIAQGAAFFGAMAVCTPGYITSEGEYLRVMSDQEALMKLARGGQWSEGLVSFDRMLDEWRKEGNMRGIEVSRV